MDARKNMDEDRKFTSGQAQNSDARIKGSYQPMRDSGTKSNQNSHSKFNRILGNLERSILSQFNSINNHNKECRHNLIQKQTTSAKVRPAVITITTSSSQDVERKKEGRETNGCQSNKHQTSNQVQEQSTSKDNITSPFKASVVKSASERLGKLTLNSKAQQQKSPRQQQQFVSSPLRSDTSTSSSTNKLPIPRPPHAHSEARSLNQTFLFGNGAPPTMLGADHRLSHDTTNANLNTLCSTLKRDATAGKIRNDKLFEELNANRHSSSPASSAKSLPAIAPKPGSQSNILHQKTNQDDEEDSGFATYQSRRSVPSKFQQNQHQQMQFTRETGEERNAIMMYHLANQPYPATHPHNSMINPQLHDSQNRQNLAFHHMIQNNNLAQNMMQQSTMQQYIQPVMPLNERFTMRDSYNDFRYHTYNQSTHPSNIMFHQDRDPRQPLAQAGYINNNHVVAHSSLNQSNSADSGQQIYANAPPKPRRYQYYEIAPNQTTVPVSQVNNGHMNMNMMPSMQQHQTPATIRSILNQQTSYNQRRTVMPQLSYKPIIAGAPSLNNLSSLSSSTVNRDTETFRNPNHLLRGSINSHIRQPTQNSHANQPMGFQLVKSKSSLDNGDVMRYREGTQTIGRNDPRNFPHHSNQPIYGYHADSSMYRRPNQPSTHLSNFNRMQPTIMGSNLQRSKSVTHLLPEIDDKALQDQSHLLPQKMSSLTSASTNHLNNVGSNQPVAFPMTHGRVYQTNGIGYHPITGYGIDTHPYNPKNQAYNYCIDRALPGSNLNANRFTNQPQFHRARSIAALNSEPALTSKLIRCSPGKVSHELRGSNKPSLDDQIKHLLIGGADNIGTRTVSASNQDHNAIYQSLDYNRSFGLVPSSSDFSSFSQASTTWSQSNGNCVVPIAPERQQLQSRQAKYPPPPSFNTTQNLPNADPHVHNPTSHLLPARNRISASSLSLAEVNEFSDMGNKHQRQYQVQQNGDSDLQNCTIYFPRKKSDTNSHLIVDLTTPKVLAKTQTTLQPTATEQSADSWSINQVGLPHMVSMSKPPVPHNSDRVSHLPIDSTLSNRPVKEYHPGCHSSDKSISDDKNTIPSSLGRTAPYYYSDLKSDEQRQALMNIVQQKSLSPPPQLLSRSTDQNSTRLTPSSATMHQSHARTLSDTLAQRRRIQSEMECKSIDDSAKPAIRKNQSHEDGANSTSEIETIEKHIVSTTNIAENIEKHTVSTTNISENIEKHTVSTTLIRENSDKQTSPASNIAENIDKLFDRSFDNQDIMEFLSNDSANHRYTFDASQFSASDFNTSTSTSESSNSSGAIGDSLNSILFCRKSEPNENRTKTNGSNSSITVSILKSHNRRCSYDGPFDPENNNVHTEDDPSEEKLKSSKICETVEVKGKRLMEVEKFKNVLGNVIDVDSCSVNNLSGTSPVNNHQTPCLS